MMVPRTVADLGHRMGPHDWSAATRQEPATPPQRHLPVAGPSSRRTPGSILREDPSATSPAKAGRRAAFLTPDRVQHRYQTLIDAFHTADRRQRGHLPYDRVLEIYSLFFHSSVGMLENDELQRFVEKCMRHSNADGALVVDYTKLADSLRKRDMEMMTKKQAEALRQTGRQGMYASPERGGGGGGSAVQQTPTSGVAAAIRMDGENGDGSWQEPAWKAAVNRDQRTRRDVGGGGGDTRAAPYASAADAAAARLVARRAAPADRSPIVGDYVSEHSPSVYSPTHARGRGMAAGPSPVAARGFDDGGYGHSPTEYYPPQSSGQYQQGHTDGPGSYHGSPTAPPMPSAAGMLGELLAACEAADEERCGRLYSTQILTCCRLRGLEESSAMLRAVIDDVIADDGRADYVKFVQQLAAQRAGQSARDHVAVMHANSPTRRQLAD